MNRTTIGIVLAGTFLVPTAWADQDALKDYTPTGTRQYCLSLPQIRNTEIVDASRILFFTVDGTAYLNELPQPCVSLNPHRSFRYKTSLSRLCNTDIITVFQAGPPVLEFGSCGLGQFERLQKKDKP